MLETVVPAVITVTATLAAVLLRRLLYPPVRPGGQAPARILGVGRRGRRGKASATGPGGLTVTMRGKPPLHLPREAVRRPLPMTQKERYRVTEDFTVKLEWQSRRVFLRPGDWRTLTAADAGTAGPHRETGAADEAGAVGRGGRPAP